MSLTNRLLKLPHEEVAQNNRLAKFTHLKSVPVSTSSEEKWDEITAKVAIKANIIKKRHNGDVQQEEIEITGGISINGDEYADTDSHTYIVSRFVNGGAKKMGELNEVQKNVVETLLSNDQLIKEVYFLNVDKYGDIYYIVTAKQPNTALRVSEIYWEVFDQDPDYAFEFKPVPEECDLKNIIPPNACKYLRTEE